MTTATFPARRVLGRAEAVEALRAMVASLPAGDAESRAQRLLERIASRADALELRSALCELGALAVVGE